MAGLTLEGFERKTLEELLAEVEAEQRANIDPGIDTTLFSLVGQLNAVIGSKLAELWELGQDLYDMLDPDKVEDAAQDALYLLTGSLRKPATKSTVTATVNLEPGASIAIGDAVASVLGNPTARFVNTEPMVNAGDSADDFDVLFEAEATGPVFANDGTLTVIETPQTGWNSITNPEDADVGENIESNAAYRLRRETELAAPGGATLIGSRADLSRLDGVEAVDILENTGSVVNGDGLPPHSFEAIVHGTASDQDIAESIFSNKPAGIEAYGSTVVTVTDSEGIEHSIGFSEPDERSVYIAIEVEVDADYDDDDDHDALKAAIVNASTDVTSANYLAPGDDLYAGRIICAALEQPGVLNARVGLAFSSITVPEDGDEKLVIARREIAVLDDGRIDVTVAS